MRSQFLINALRNHLVGVQPCASEMGFIYLYLLFYQAEYLKALILHLSRMQRRKDYLQDKLLVDVAFGHGWLEVRALQETQKELIHQLEEEQAPKY